jgi:hypothetical protein
VDDLELVDETAGLVALVSPPAIEPRVGLLVLDVVCIDVDRLLRAKINLYDNPIFYII